MEEEIRQYLRSKGHSQFKVRAAFFDMDGVLFGSMPYHARSWVQTMTNHGLNFTEKDAYLNEGRTGIATITDFFIRQKGCTPSREEVQQMYDEKKDLFNKISKTSIIPSVDKLLNALQAAGIEMYLVTGSAQQTLLNTLNTHFPGVFAPERMVTAFDVTQGKPHPEPYLKALAKSGCRANEVFVVENAPLGVRSAVAAGLFTIAVNTGILDDADLACECPDSGIVLPNMQSVIDSLDTLLDNIKI